MEIKISQTHFEYLYPQYHLSNESPVNFHTPHYFVYFPYDK